jgi:drug/metabolite transporter (DMT)-like permease
MAARLSTEWVIVGVAFLALTGFVLKANNKVLATSYDRYVTVLAMQFIAFTIMALVVTFKIGWEKVWESLRKMSAKHTGLLLVGGIGDLLLVLISMRLLMSEDIGHLGILDMAIGTLLAVGGGYLIFEEKVTLWRVVGLFVILGGAYLTTL